MKEESYKDITVEEVKQQVEFMEMLNNSADVDWADDEADNDDEYYEEYDDVADDF